MRISVLSDAARSVLESLRSEIAIAEAFADQDRELVVVPIQPLWCLVEFVHLYCGDFRKTLREKDLECFEQGFSILHEALRGIAIIDQHPLHGKTAKVEARLLLFLTRATREWIDGVYSRSTCTGPTQEDRVVYAIVKRALQEPIIQAHLRATASDRGVPVTVDYRMLVVLLELVDDYMCAGVNNESDSAG